MDIEGINYMNIFGLFEDKKTKEELKTANEQIALLQKKLNEAEKRNDELHGLIASINALNEELKMENESLKRSKSYSEEVGELIASVETITPNQTGEYKPATKKGERSLTRKQKSKKSNPTDTISNKEEVANDATAKADAGKPKRRGRKLKSTAEVLNVADKKTIKEKKHDQGENVDFKDAILNKEEKPEYIELQAVDKSKKRGRKPKVARDGAKTIDNGVSSKDSKLGRKARAKKKPVKDGTIESKPVVREEETKVVPTETVVTVEPTEAAVMGIDEYENYDAIKPSKPASKPKRNYTRRKPVYASKTGTNAKKPQKKAGDVKATKPGKIESYADMLAITQSGNKNNK